MISKPMETALNNHLNEELFSAYLYFSIAAYFESLSLTGFASWMKVQATEELSHAFKFYNFIVERGGTVTLDTIDKPQAQWESAKIAVEDVYAHEQKISKLINQLADTALEEKDHAAGIFLQWFITEQVEEEASVGHIVDQFNLIGNQPGAIYHLDKEVGGRSADPNLLFPGLFGA